MRVVTYEHEGKHCWHCGVCGQRFLVYAHQTLRMPGANILVGNQVIASVCDPCLPELRIKAEALFPHPQVER